MLYQKSIAKFSVLKCQFIVIGFIVVVVVVLGAISIVKRGLHGTFKNIKAFESIIKRFQFIFVRRLFSGVRIGHFTAKWSQHNRIT